MLDGFLYDVFSTNSCDCYLQFQLYVEKHNSLLRRVLLV